VAKVLKVAANLRSLDTIKEWGEKLKRQHRPANLLELPPFMQPKESASAPMVRQTAPQPTGPVEPPAPAASEAPAKRLICSHCGAKISYPEGKFCWNNSARFSGQQYCREHQALFS
jgi:hypothetical protein